MRFGPPRRRMERPQPGLGWLELVGLHRKDQVGIVRTDIVQPRIDLRQLEAKEVPRRLGLSSEKGICRNAVHIAAPEDRDFLALSFGVNF